MSTYLAIILYILSIVGGLLALVAGKKVPQKRFLVGVSVHLLFIVLFVITITSGDKSATLPFFIRLSFLFVICSGLILAGVAWKSNVHILPRLYFSLFFLTLLLFLFSPSRTINFLLTARYADTLGKVFSVGENYFLEEQTSMVTGDAAIPHYKLILKHGMFHETIERDIVFGGNLDSILVLGFTAGKEAMIRGYRSKNTYVSTEIDSSDVSVKLAREKKNQIERKL